MGIEISGGSGPPPREAAEAGKPQTTTQTTNPSRAATSAATGSGGSDQLQLSNQAAQLQALEAEVANLPVVNTQRVQDVQRTLATGSFQIKPAQVADKMLQFEAGLGKAQ